METVVGLLQTQNGRSNIMSTTSYVCKLLSVKLEGKTGADFRVVAKQISNAMTVGRLFDDLPMLSSTYDYGIGEHEEDNVTRLVQVMSNLVNQLFLSLEHISWARENNIITCGKSVPWGTAVTSCWTASLFLSLFKTVRKLRKLRHKRRQLIKAQQLVNAEKCEISTPSFRDSMTDVMQQERKEVLNIMKNGSSLMSAVNGMPAGFLWSGQLSVAQSATFGIMSSLVGLYQLATAKEKLKAN